MEGVFLEEWVKEDGQESGRVRTGYGVDFEENEGAES